MKKSVLIGFISIVSLTAYSQQDPLKELECKTYAETVGKNLKDSENPKKNLKSATWLKLGNSYLDLALRCTSDSTAAEKAVNAYNKGSEVEKAAGGKKIKDFEKALSENNLGLAFLQQGAAFYGAKNIKMASKYFNLSSGINAKDTLSALYSGIAAQQLGELPGAISSFNRYLDNGGKDASVIFSLSQALKAEKRFDEAIAVLKKGKAIYPNYKDFDNEVINIYLASDKIDSAISELEKNASDATGLQQLGYLYDMKTQDYLTDLNKTRDQVEKSNTADLEKKVATEKDKLSAYEGEIAALTAKLKKEPKNAAANKKKIEETTAQKNAIAANIEKLNADITSRKANSGGEALLKTLSEKEATHKKWQEKTMAVYTKVLAQDPNNYDVNFNMAVMHFNQAVEIKKVADGMDMKAFQKNGKDIEMKACLEFNMSKPFFEKCNAVKPNDPVVTENLKNLVGILEQCK